MSNLRRFQTKARELAGSGKFHGWRPLAFEMQFQDGFEEAREWLLSPETREELERLCQEARHSTNSARHKAA